MSRPPLSKDGIPVLVVLLRDAMLLLGMPEQLGELVEGEVLVQWVGRVGADLAPEDQGVMADKGQGAMGGWARHHNNENPSKSKCETQSANSVIIFYLHVDKIIFWR